MRSWLWPQVESWSEIAERMNAIKLEEVLGGPKSPDADEEERNIREGIAKDIAMMKKAGIEIVDPDIED